MNITLFGASGRVGKLLSSELLKRGHTVTAFVHSNTSTLAESSNLHIIVGDVHNQNDVQRAVEHADVIISTLGSWGTPTKDIVSSATANLLPFMQGKRFVGVTGAGAKLKSEKFGPSGIFGRLLLRCIASPVLKDADKHLRLLSESPHDWTVVRSPVMTNRNKTSYTLSDKPPKPWQTITRTAVVQALVDLAENKTHSKNAPFITL